MEDLMRRQTYLQHAFPAGSAHQTTHRQCFLRHCSALSETVAHHVTICGHYQFLLQHWAICSCSTDENICTLVSPGAAVQSFIMVNGSQGVKTRCRCTIWKLSVSYKHTPNIFTVSIKYPYTEAQKKLNCHNKNTQVKPLITDLHFNIFQFWKGFLLFITDF
jgi:hypothetical protein